jgi:hypothetical protein
MEHKEKVMIVSPSEYDPLYKLLELYEKKKMGAKER